MICFHTFQSIVVTEVIEKTDTGPVSGLLNTKVFINYKGFTSDGQMCEIGGIGGQRREKGKSVP